MLAIGQKKAMTLETVRAVKFIFKQFRLNAVKVREGERGRKHKALLCNQTVRQREACKLGER